ncbi:YdcF family protein [Muricoccus radiodurans]|uniref:YdcF family protein n=1 Tax=Muricoccus radiodurans TaxID=2231721 RepID=UPI003CF7F2C1
MTTAPRPAIVIFGAAVRRDGLPSDTLRRRVAAAVRTGAPLQNPLYIPTGAQGRHGPRESLVMAALLREAGIPAESIREEPTGADTLSSAWATAALLRGHAGDVLAVSSRYHLPRCVMLLRLAGLKARPGLPAQPGPGFAEWRWRLREAPAIPYDAVLAVWRRLVSRRPG